MDDVRRLAISLYAAYAKAIGSKTSFDRLSIANKHAWEKVAQKALRELVFER